MRALCNEEFLALWESGSRLHSLDQGLLAIHALFPEAAEQSPADWPLGRRNRALARVRTLYFGPQLRGWTVCAQCGEKLEFELDLSSVVQHPRNDPAQTIEWKGCAFRLPTSRDLAAIAGEPNTKAAVLRLLEQCNLREKESSANSEDCAWSEEEIEKLSVEMSLADPLAEIALSIECPVCTWSGEEPLDLAAFLWAELEARARRLLGEVHALASCYGWHEAEILGLSDARRAMYLQMVRG